MTLWKGVNKYNLIQEWDVSFIISVCVVAVEVNCVSFVEFSRHDLIHSDSIILLYAFLNMNCFLNF